MKNSNEKEKIEAFVNACQQAGRYGLLRTSSGNMSCRLDDRRVLLTVSRSWLERLTTEDVAICRLEDGTCENGRRPTIESVFHLGILRRRPDVNVVLHFQSICATALCCGDPRRYNFHVLPEVPYYLGDPAVVEYLQPGSLELAEAVIRAGADHDIILLRNHGQVALGRDCDDVFEKALFLELACQVLLLQKDPVCLTATQIEIITRKKTGV